MFHIIQKRHVRAKYINPTRKEAVLEFHTITFKCIVTEYMASLDTPRLGIWKQVWWSTFGNKKDSM
jgi:hypothetical protein